jgi:multicomponent Na+:H+ antiporter subunit G
MELISNVIVGLGVFFALLGTVGILRLPDFYTRAHAAAKPDTLGVALTMIGLSLRDGLTVSSAKMLLIGILIAIANPAASHALGRSAVRCGLAPWMRSKEGGK